MFLDFTHDDRVSYTLEDGFDIHLFNNLTPENSAMLQALYSRSKDSVVVKHDQITSENVSNFMEKYYIGYGHKSIGDCGTITLFLENVSILAAKAIQNHALYNGQECSTRYLDFGRETLMLDDYALRFLQISKAETLQAVTSHFDLLNTLYRLCFNTLVEKWSSGVTSSIQKKAVKAAAFDVARGYIPAGRRTNLSWHTTLSNARSQLKKLMGHPLKEVRKLATKLNHFLSTNFPNSFETPTELVSHHKASIYEDIHYSHIERLFFNINNNDVKNIVKFRRLQGTDPVFEKFFRKRLPTDEIPNIFNKLCIFTNTIKIDYGSWRDLARHRNSYHTEPLLTTKIGMGSWYTSLFSNNTLFCEHVLKVERSLQRLSEHFNEYDLQYFIPLGYLVSAEMVHGLAEQIYIAELRSKETVHPTVRKIAVDMGNSIKRAYPNMHLFMDFTEIPDEPCGIVEKRGAQDIVEKE